MVNNFILAIAMAVAVYINPDSVMLVGIIFAGIIFYQAIE